MNMKRNPSNQEFDSPLRLCIPIPSRRLGGMYTFIDNWRCWLDTRGIPHTQNADEDYDILFVNSWAVPYRLVARVKRERPHVRVVQRVDGSAEDYGRFDGSDAKQARVNMLADLTIMQSRYSKYSTTQKYKVIQQSGPVIYNPVNVHLFHPENARSRSERRIRICNVSFSTNRCKGTWQFGELARQNPDLDFVLSGN